MHSHPSTATVIRLGGKMPGALVPGNATRSVWGYGSLAGCGLGWIVRRCRDPRDETEKGSRKENSTRVAETGHVHALSLTPNPATGDGQSRSVFCWFFAQRNQEGW